MSSTLARDLDKDLAAAFAPFINETALGLRRSLRAALNFALFDASAREIVVDKMALLHGIYADGQSPTPQTASSTWLASWMSGERLEPVTVFGSRYSHDPKLTTALEEGVPIVASRSLRSGVLVRAVQLAQETVGRDVADLRHVLFELLLETPSPLQLSAKQLLSLKLFLVDRIGKEPEPGEKMEVWRSIIPGETVRTLSDAPAFVDTLGREAFAQVLAARVVEVGESLRRRKDSGEPGCDFAFIFHMDGAWGSGKSSILNFLKADLESAPSPWLVVEFNAWRNQHRKPPWWPIITEVGTAAVKGRRWYQFPKAWRIWKTWQWRINWLPIAIPFLVALAILLLVAPRISAGIGEVGKAVADIVGGLVALTAIGGISLAAVRRLVFGSVSTADAYAQSTSEPYQPIIDRFNRLVAAEKRPIAVFIDDLDRCDCGYVIDLLEGIQTLLRSAPIVYVVAGDRKWISSSFEKRYADFSGSIGSPGRPLGYLFLDKVFQLSTSIPQLSPERQKQFWRRLLDRNDEAADANARAKLEAEARQKLEGKTRHEDIQREIDAAPAGSLQQEVIRGVAAKQITSPEAVRSTEHRLQSFADLLEANPRSMKRLVNAYGLNHARAYLEGRKVEVEALARWTIVELRWPLLADHMMQNWSDIEAEGFSKHKFPEELKGVWADEDVKAVIGTANDPGHLSSDALKPILG